VHGSGTAQSGTPASSPGYPRTGGGALTRVVGRFLMGVAGWRIDGALPEVPKFVICVAPHTSNWDFAIGYAAKMAVGLRASWLGKHTLFRGLMGPLLRHMGGIPVDRGAPSGVVEQAAEWFRDSTRLALGVAPEGTRKKVKRWKSGFYRIARQAQVPIVPVALDWGRKTIRIGASFHPTASEQADLAALQAFFRSARGKRPEMGFPEPG